MSVKHLQAYRTEIKLTHYEKGCEKAKNVSDQHNSVMRKHTSNGETPGAEATGIVGVHSLMERLFCHCSHPYHQVCGQGEHKPRARQAQRCTYELFWTTSLFQGLYTS